MKSFGLTDRGKVRAENQDCFEIEYIESRDCLAVVLCDGMGGASAGSILPATIISALGIAIYGMFVAIVVPQTKKSKATAATAPIEVI